MTSDAKGPGMDSWRENEVSSSNLTHNDFFLWDYIKSVMYVCTGQMAN
jgi:hypothetical protein